MRRVSDNVANPVLTARRNASATPTTSSSPNPRTIGIGDSSSTRKPAAVARQAVAIIGPPRTAASTAARGGDAPARVASTKRAWNWIA